MWGTSWRQRLRLCRCICAMAAADRLAPIVPARARPAPAPWRPGVTVIIPERDAPEMLARALASLDVALARDRRTAAGDRRRQRRAPRGLSTGCGTLSRRRNGYTSTRRSASPAPSSADCARARYDGTYLMNNDMTLDPRRARRAAAVARARRVRDRLADLPAGRAVGPPRGNGIHRLVRRPFGRASVSRAAALVAGAARAPLRERRRRAVPHGAARPLRA